MKDEEAYLFAEIVRLENMLSIEEVLEISKEFKLDKY